MLQRSRERRFKASLPTWYLFFKRSFKQPKRGFNQQKSGRYRGYQNWPMGTVNLKVDWTSKIRSNHQPKKPGWCPSMSGFTIGSSSFPRKNCRKFTESHWRGAVDVQLTFNQFSWKAGLYPMFMENSIYHDISWYIYIHTPILPIFTHYIIKLAIKLWGFFQIRFRIWSSQAWPQQQQRVATRLWAWDCADARRSINNGWADHVPGFTGDDSFIWGLFLLMFI